MYIVPRTTLSISAALLFLLGFAHGAHAAGDASTGATIFQQCGACHSAEQGKTIVGPSLYGVIGRPAGSLAGYAYSQAMQDAASKGLTWTPDNVAHYLENPRKYLNDFAGSDAPNKMPFSLSDQKDRDDVVAYLQSLGGP